MFGRGDGHDTGADGEVYARTARFVQKFIIHLVVEKELCNQKFGPRVTFFLQREKIAVQILCFIMLFRVTGACNVEICGAVQITCQIRSMGEMPAVKLFIAHIGRSVAAQGQDMVHIGFLQLCCYRINVFFPGAHTGHMCQGIDFQVILDIGSDFHGFLRLAAAGPVGNADKVRLQPGKGIQHQKRIGKFLFLFGRKNLKGKNLLIFRKKFFYHLFNLFNMNFILDCI